MTCQNRRSAAARPSLATAALGAALLLGNAPAAGAATPPSDSQTQLRDKVEIALQRLKGDLAQSVDVSVDGGSVRLSGTVPTARQKAWAAQAARDVDGVRRVTNELSARTADRESTHASDSLERRLERRFDLDPDQLGLVASGGVVRVDGLVQSWDTARAITDALKQDLGVDRVSNAVTWVAELPAGYEDDKGRSAGETDGNE